MLILLFTICSFVLAQSGKADVSVNEHEHQHQLRGAILDGAFENPALWGETETGTATVGPYAQCGGQHYLGSTTCITGYACMSSDDYYSQCRPKEGPVSAGTVGSYGQCGGKHYSGSTMCSNDWDCVASDEYYWQCRPPTAPVITLIGSGRLDLELGAIFFDEGATAEFAITASGTVDTSTVGIYAITYTGTDAAGNVGTATRTVNVVDTTPPVITLNGSASVTHELDTPYTDAGATADGGETVTTSGTVDVHTPGAYTLAYGATDTSGNVALAATRRVVTVMGITAPVNSRE